MSKVQELMSLVRKQNQSTTSQIDNDIVLCNQNSKVVHSSYSDLSPKGPNKTPKNVGWMPGMNYIPHGSGSNTGF